MVDKDTPVVTHGLEKRYRRGWALRDCSVVVPPGRVTALVGPNGAGKSTLMGVITGLTGRTGGDIAVFGAVPGGRGVYPEISFLGQQKPLYPQLTVRETLRLGERMNPRWDAAHAAEVVRSLDTDAKVRTLSSGQRTRLALALALGRRPRLVLLDEPLADLDPLARHEVLELVRRHGQAEGMAVMLSSHVLAELEGVCDHLILLKDGKQQVTGEVADLVEGHLLGVGPPGAPWPVPAADV
ncbi:ABC transporter ATP-binding protein, partial [Actinokineospora pegani]|uniref:ABC transporter ATP-binding protein n=1 Tax=Actinokineospora pegani TaxID=2654637 RepID=UPI0018D4B367